MRNPRRQHRKPPYYKIQVFDEITQSWKDQRKISDTIDEARDFIAREISPRKARVVVVERSARYVLEADS